MSKKWDIRMLRMAREVSTWSKDPSTQVGAVIANYKRMISTGYNGFPSLVRDETELYADREKKLQLIVHAEVNAILNYERSVKGCTLYVYPFMPCSNCAKLIIQAGIRRVVYTYGTPADERWADEFAKSHELFDLVNFNMASKFIDAQGYHISELDIPYVEVIA